MITSEKRAQPLSQRERVVAERPGEGFPTPPFAAAVSSCIEQGSYPLTRRLRRHPLPPGEGRRPLSRRERVVAERPGEGRAYLSSSGEWLPGRARPRDIGSPADLLDHPREPLFNFVVGEAKLQEPVALDEVAAIAVELGLMEMLPAVDLNRQTEVVAAEIDNEARDRDLTPEFQTVQPSIAQLLPKRVLRPRTVRSKPPRNLVLWRNHGAKLRPTFRSAQYMARPCRGSTHGRVAPHPVAPRPPSPAGRGAAPMKS